MGHDRLQKLDHHLRFEDGLAPTDEEYVLEVDLSLEAFELRTLSEDRVHVEWSALEETEIRDGCCLVRVNPRGTCFLLGKYLNVDD